MGVAATTAALLSGCQGGGDSVAATSYESYLSGWEGKTYPMKLSDLSKAQFVLSSIFFEHVHSGVEYSYLEDNGTTVKDVTDENGTLTYKFGKNHIFSIGDIVLGTVNIANAPLLREYAPKKVRTKYFSDTNQTISNISAFLFSIDNDDNASNGVQITQSMRDSVPPGTFVDFTSATFDTDYITLIETITAASAAGQRSTLYNDLPILQEAMSEDTDVIAFSVDCHDADFQGFSANFSTMSLDVNHLILSGGTWGTVLDGTVENGTYSGSWTQDGGGSGTFHYVIPE